MRRPWKLPTLEESANLRYFFFFYLYLMQGIPAGFALTAIAGYLAARGTDPIHIGSFIAITGLPWAFQFIWGPVIDRFRASVMGDRKQWLLLSQAVACTASFLLLFASEPSKDLQLLTIVFLIHSIFASIQDASADAIAIDITPVKERGRANAFMRGGFLAGLAAGSAGLSVLLHAYGFRPAALTQSLLLSTFCLLTFFIRLRADNKILPATFNPQKAMSTGSNPSLQKLFAGIFRSVTVRRKLYYFVLLLMVYALFSIFIRSFTYHLIKFEGWHDRSLSLMQGGWGTAVVLLFLIFGGKLSDKYGHFRFQQIVLMLIAAFLLVFSASFALWSNTIVASTGLLLWNCADPMLSVAAFPILMSFCQKPVEGSQFTLYMAMINLADVTGSYITGWALHAVSAPALGVICGIGILMIVTVYHRFMMTSQIYETIS